MKAAAATYKIVNSMEKKNISQVFHFNIPAQEGINLRPAGLPVYGTGEFILPLYLLPASRSAAASETPAASAVR